MIRTGRRGKFIACSGFPRCRNTAPIEKLEELRAKSPTTEHVAPPNGSGKGAKAAAAAPGAKGKGGVTNVADLGPPPEGFAWTRTGKPVVEKWPEGELHCPNCGSEMALKSGRFGPFFSCTGYPKCRTSVNLRGEAKKRAEADNPPPEKPKPIPTDIKCAECGAPMLIRTGRSGRFLGCSAYPKCKATSPLPIELMSK